MGVHRVDSVVLGFDGSFLKGLYRVPRLLTGFTGLRLQPTLE